MLVLSQSHTETSIALRKASVWALLCLLRFRLTVKEVYGINTAFKLWAPETGWPWHDTRFSRKGQSQLGKRSFLCDTCCLSVRQVICGNNEKASAQAGGGPQALLLFFLLFICISLGRRLILSLSHGTAVVESGTGRCPHCAPGSRCFSKRFGCSPAQISSLLDWMWHQHEKTAEFRWHL